MAFATIPAWSTTAGTNTEIDGISLAENVMVPSAVNNAFREMMSQVAEFTRRGSDLASADPLNLDSIDTMYLDITGSTTVTSVTLTDGHSRRARATGAFQLTASATLVVNGSTSSNYTTTAGDMLFFEGYSGGTVRVWSMGQSTAATTSAAGIVELATQTEAATLTDTSRAITADGLFFLGGYTTTATAAGTTTLTVTSTYNQYFTGTTTQTVVLPVTSTLVLGRSYRVVNNSTGAVTVQSSGANTIAVLAAGVTAVFTCILTSGTTAASWDHRIILALGTPQASTSGTAIDFTGIPAWAKRITVNLMGVSANGTAGMLLFLGDAGGIENTGYVNGTSNGATSTSSFPINGGASAAAGIYSGTLTLTLVEVSSFTWALAGIIGRSDTAAAFSVGGYKSLSDTLTQVRVTAGGDTFDAGKINILYE